MSLFDDMQHSCTIFFPTVTRQASGGELIAWPAQNVRAANVPCLIRQGAGGERDEFSQSERPANTHTIAFAGDNDGGVQPGDQLVNDHTGKIYRFTGDMPQEGYGGIEDFNIISVRELN